MIIIIMILSDEEFKQLQCGDSNVFKKLYLHYEKIVYNFILIKTHNDENAVNDIFSDTFHSAFLSISKLKNNKNIQGWLLQIASRRLCDYLRKKYKEKNNTPESDDYIQKDVLNIMLQNEKTVYINLAIDSLKPEFKEVIKMKYIENRSQNEIAQMLNTKVSTIEGLLFRAKKSLKKELERLDII